ncbi:MAG: ATP-binding cassette domain-containing protein [Coriobacteriia bacterium]|nr:ATP-binding cassette domain-containing protein [Coriobacteriia bacterium]
MAAQSKNVQEVLKLDKIDKTFNPGSPDALHALDELSLSIREGDFITLIGSNGAGKSTMLNAIAGSFKLDSGTIYLRDKDITKLSEEDRAAFVARVFQDPKLGTAPRMTVAENLALAARRGKSRGLRLAINAEDREAFKEVLAPVGLGLEDRLDSEIGLLSGGQRQAISLIMTSLVKPDILLLDEHTANLDPKTAKVILELTKKMIEDNKLSAIMITHNLSDALEYGNRMVFLHKGKVLHDYSQEEKKEFSTLELFELMGKYQ